MWNGTMFVDLDWPLNASPVVSISWASCFFNVSVIVYCYISASVDGRLPFWCVCFANKVLCLSWVLKIVENLWAPDPLAGVEGDCCPFHKNPHPGPALGLRSLPQWKISGNALDLMMDSKKTKRGKAQTTDAMTKSRCTAAWGSDEKTSSCR